MTSSQSSRQIRSRPIAQHEAKDGVSPGCLHERLAVLEKGWHASCAPLRVEAVDEVAKWEERRMLAQGQPNTERVGARRPSTTRLVVCQPEQSTVREVHREARRPPRATIGHRLPEHGDIRVVTADQPPVKGLLEGPHHSRGRTSSRRARTAVSAGRGLPQLTQRFFVLGQVYRSVYLSWFSTARGTRGVPRRLRREWGVVDDHWPGEAEGDRSGLTSAVGKAIVPRLGARPVWPRWPSGRLPRVRRGSDLPQGRRR